MDSISETTQTFTCVDCKRTLPVQTQGGTGYGVCNDAEQEFRRGREVCYRCCGIRDRRHMKRNGRIDLYLHGSTITNWPGTLVFGLVDRKVSDHNMAGKNGRTDVWFIGPDGSTWHGVNIGDHQILRCKRTKAGKAVT